MMKQYYLCLFLVLISSSGLMAQDYFLKDKGPFLDNIPSPEAFLGYPIGARHTRHDQMVAYLEKLSELSDRAQIIYYGQTYEHRKLVILQISKAAHLQNIDAHQAKHLEVCDPQKNVTDYSDLPVFINLGYNVHGNEPSGGEAALLSAYILVASNHPQIQQFREESIVFLDPTINPDGRDRHSSWANTYRGNPLVSDGLDAEHNEAWPRGRTNHYWFDLNRDWLLGIHPESRGKLNWYHEWYPNVVTDVHEMGTNSTYFFEPMKDNASQDPIMPKENYTTLNDTFGKYYARALDSIGSFYFTKEVFDGTYPGYGSSYPDLQGGLGILFEQASSRGHLQETSTTPMSFAFTIRNQLTTSLATVQAAVENKELLYNYLKDFFKSAISKASRNPVKAYVFGAAKDANRNKAFIDKLLLHRVKVYRLNQSISKNGMSFESGKAFVVPTQQPQYRMVQTFFETYDQFRDSVFYDASGWSLANFYNMPYAELNNNPSGDEIKNTQDLVSISPPKKSEYAYVIPWEDYNAMPALYYFLKKNVTVTAAYKPFQAEVEGKAREFSYGTLVIPVRSRQGVNPSDLFQMIQNASREFGINIYSLNTGYSLQGIDLGSSYFSPVQKPKALMLIGGSISSYEAGEVWHLLDTRMGMPITKVPMRLFDRINWDKYNTLVMVSSRYAELDSVRSARIQSWVSKGNTLITIRQASSWAIRQKIVKEKLVIAKKEKNEKMPPKRLPYVDAPENNGKNAVGGTIFKVNLDLTHPLAFGYTSREIPVYRNSTVWLAPSQNPYATVAKYTDDPLIDGFITQKNLNEFLKPSASLIVSALGRGRVVMFADNPNFRGSWYGTNRLFMNALFFGDRIYVPRVGEEE